MQNLQQMSSRNRIPAALEPYLRLPPEASLIVLTGTLGCSVNWLTARFVGSLLTGQHAVAPTDAAGDAPAVVLASWMRDFAFWKTELRRAVGVDAAKMMKDGRLGFVDCFTTLAGMSEASVMTDMETNIISSVTQACAQYRPVLLVLDSPDVLLALDLCTAQQLSSLLLRLRSAVHSVMMTCSADLPLLAAATGDADHHVTLLEAETAAFVVQQAHAARAIMSVRELDTGAAKDISGVLRITRGGGAHDFDDESEDEVKEMEALYLVQRDGNAKVFERGSSSI